MKTPLPQMKIPQLDSASVRFDRRRGCLYDRVRLRMGDWLPGSFRMFESPIGHQDFTGRVKTEADTNMWQFGRLPAPLDIVIGRIGVVLAPTVSDGDRAFFMTFCYWTLRLLQKNMHGGPLEPVVVLADPERIIDGFGTPAAAGIEKPGRGVFYDLTDFGEFRLYIPPACDFAFEFRGPAGCVLQSDFDLLVMLDGLRGWPIQ